MFFYTLYFKKYTRDDASEHDPTNTSRNELTGERERRKFHIALPEASCGFDCMIFRIWYEFAWSTTLSDTREWTTT